MKTRAFEADMRQLPDMLDFIIGEFAACNTGSRQENLVKVSCEEALANVVLYAYAGTQGMVEIACGILSDEGMFMLQIADSGIPYNPLEGDMPDIEAGLEERKVGGLGVYLYMTIMDDVSYVYKDGKNILTLCKKISRKAM